MKFKTAFQPALGENTLSITASFIANFIASIIASNHTHLHQNTGTLAFASAQTLQNPEKFMGTLACVACCRNAKQ